VHEVLNYLPKSVQPKGPGPAARDRDGRDARGGGHRLDRFIATYRAKYPKAVECLAKDREVLLILTTSRPSTGYTCAPPTLSIHGIDRTKGLVSRARLLGLIFKLARSAEKSFKRPRCFDRLAEVIAGVRFVDGASRLTD